METCNTSKGDDSKFLSATQQSTIIRCSGEKRNNFIACFEEDVEYKYYKDCYAAYTSKEKIARYLKKRKMDKATSSLPSLAKEHNFCSVSDTTKHGIMTLWMTE